MNYKEAISYLLEIEHFGTKLGLANVTRLLEKLGNPHNGLKVIHITGTNGKGSVCSMIASILQKAGYKVGLYTSPHLRKLNERFQINGKDISDEDIARLTELVKKHRGDQTFFEVTTAMAFQYYKEQKVDFLVLEVGLGGRLDATNVVTPMLSIITNVGIEHTDYLGKNIVNIAYEKAGIIKEKVPVVTAAEGKALEVISNVAKEKKSPIFIITKPTRKYALSLKGNFQQINAEIAARSIDVLINYNNLGISKSDIDAGLKSASIPARLEYIKKNVLVDCAHNPHAVKSLIGELKKLKKKIVLVIGICKDKDRKQILQLLEPFTSSIIFTRAKVPRATDPKELAKHVTKKYKIIEDSKEALKYAESIASKNEIVLVAGSIYLVGEIYE